MPRPDIDPRAKQLLGRFDLTDAADRPVRTYSGGMRRRLDVAAALVSRPPVLFLDEPTTGLDLQSRGELWDMIRELVADGTTVLLTTQYMEEADRLAKRIAVIDRGKVIANDSPAALKSQMGGTVIELGMGKEAAAARAWEVLSRFQSGHAERDGTTVRYTTPDGAQFLIEALRSLDTERLSPVTLTVREPSLDDVFLSLTGHRAEPTDGQEQPAEGARRRRGAA
jgi:ABC-type multidrug transport system ATPase subunit